MSTLLLTMILAGIITTGGLLFFAIGWLITGKSKIAPGACGKDPTRKKNEKDGCGSNVSCSLCERPKENKNKENLNKENETK